MFGLSGLTTGIVAGAALLGLLFLYNLAENADIRGKERELVLAEARQRAMVLIEKRNADNVEISDLDAAGLCAELGGRWVPNESRCD